MDVDHLFFELQNFVIAHYFLKGMMGIFLMKLIFESLLLFLKFVNELENLHSVALLEIRKGLIF